MQKAHKNINWENFPSISTPLNEKNLNDMDVAIDTIDDRVIILDSTKLDKSDASLFVQSIEFNRANGVFTIAYFNGTTATIDTMLEKLAVNFSYDRQTERLIITLDDGTVQYVDLSALITQYEFLDSDTIAFILNENGKISAKVKEGSIQEKHLQPNYLADIKLEVSKAEASKNAAATSETNAKASENSAKESKDAAKESENSAKIYAENAETSAANATEKAAEAENSAISAAGSATISAEKADSAATSEENSANAANAAATSAMAATQKANEAETSASNAKSSETECKNTADMINNAIENINQSVPRFVINLEDGNLYHTQSKFAFTVNYITGNLDWGLTV